VLAEHCWDIIGLLLLSGMVSFTYQRLGWTWMSISTVPITIIGAALGILLGFRSNEAYNRYNEARTLWGAIVNACRTLTRQILTLIAGQPECQVQEIRRETVYLVIALGHSLRRQLWRQQPAEDLQRLFPESEVGELLRNRNIPDAILHEIARKIQEAADRGWIHAMHVSLLHETIRDLSNAQGGRERIKNTPIPRSYTYVTHKIVIAYCLALPFGLLSELGLVMPLAALLISFVFLMLNRFAMLIEDPFCTTYSGLPLLSITRNIEINLRQRLGESRLPEEVTPVDNILP
jgi:putative membrane protein